MKNLPFDEALGKAQSWIGNHDIYAVGESEKDGEKVIMVFATDTLLVADIIPKEFHGHRVIFYNSEEVVPHEPDQEE